MFIGTCSDVISSLLIFSLLLGIRVNNGKSVKFENDCLQLCFACERNLKYLFFYDILST